MDPDELLPDMSHFAGQVLKEEIGVRRSVPVGDLGDLVVSSITRARNPWQLVAVSVTVAGLEKPANECSRHPAPGMRSTRVVVVGF
jgi:hypothetical protein